MFDAGPTEWAPTPGTLPRVRVTVKAEGALAVLAYFNCHVYIVIYWPI